MTLYTATGLADIVEQFEALADKHDKAGLFAKTLRAQERELAVGRHYRSAADILRNTTLTPDPIIAELVAALKGAVDSLEYVKTVAPDLIGYGVRNERIDAANIVLAKIEGEA